MNKFDRILELDDELFNVYKDKIPEIIKFNKTSIIPQTGSSLFLLTSNIDQIKLGIFDLYENENLYSINILFRSLIEHHLKFLYIFFRIVIDKNDKVGNEYMKLCSLMEGIKLGNAYKEISKITGKVINIDPYDVLKNLKGDFSKYPKKEIIEKSKQFNYREVIHFIYENLNKLKKLGFDSLPLKLIISYSDLSSFIHGGPNSLLLLSKFTNEDIRHEEVLKKMEITFQNACSTKLFSFMVFSFYDVSFKNAYLEINKIFENYKNVFTPSSL